MMTQGIWMWCECLFVLYSAVRFVRSAVANVRSAVANAYSAVRNIELKRYDEVFRCPYVNNSSQLSLYFYYYYPYSKSFGTYKYRFVAISLTRAYARTFCNFSISSITSITTPSNTLTAKGLYGDKRCDRSDRRMAFLTKKREKTEDRRGNGRAI